MDAERGEIIAAGGGRGEGCASLDAFALGRLKKASPRPNVCFLGTASGDADGEIDEFYAAFEGCRCVHLSLFRPSRRDAAATLAAAELIVVGGGNTANLLALWRLHGVDSLVRAAHEEGATILGFSAGASALFESSVSDSFGGLDIVDGLGLVPGLFSPHFGNPKRRAKWREAGAAAYGVEAGAALCFAGEAPRGVHWRVGAGVFGCVDGAPAALPSTWIGT